MKDAAEGRAAIVAADGQGAVVGCAGVFHRAGAGQGTDGGVEVVQAQDAVGLDDMGRSATEA